MTGRVSSKYKAIKPVEPRTRNLILWEDRAGNIHREPIGPAMLQQPLHLANRARIAKPWKGMTTRQGKYWFSQLGRHVWHDSMLERWALMFLDFGADIAAVSSQPCLMQFDDGSYHYPDYFVAYGDGRRSIVDVHFAGFDNERTLRKFQNTQRACERIGWSFELFRTVNPVVLANVELLAMYRSPLYALDADVLERVLTVVDGLPFAEALVALGDSVRARSVCRIYHLLWTGDLIADLTSPFGDYTILRSN